MIQFKDTIKQNKKKYFIVILILISCFYVFYKYYNFKKYVNIYNHESIALTEKIENYSINRLENVPSNKKDFNMMLEWLKNHEEIEKIIEYGVSFKYDSLDQSLSIYSFGVDKIDDSLKTPSFSKPTDEYSVFGANDVIDQWSFLDIFDTNGKDVLLFKIFIDEDYLCRNFVNTDAYSNKKFSIPYANSYVFYQGNKKVSKKLELQLKEKIRPYKHFTNLNDSTKFFFIRFKNSRFFPVCIDDEIDLTVLDIEIKETLVNNKIDYAIIPVLNNFGKSIN